jgi:hypothetical protein
VDLPGGTRHIVLLVTYMIQGGTRPTGAVVEVSCSNNGLMCVANELLKHACACCRESGAAAPILPARRQLDSELETHSLSMYA